MATALIDVVVPNATLNIAQKPIAACRGKQLILRDQSTAVFAAHKRMFLIRIRMAAQKLNLLRLQP
jgi:hypothetical protein